MPEKKKRRPWYRVRRVWGGLFATAGLALASIPAAPVIATVAGIALTTQTAAIIVGGIGTYVFGVGVGHKHGREIE